MYSEEELIERCKSKDNAACKYLYETYAKFLFGVCLRYIIDRSTAEDLLHDGFLRIFTNIHTFSFKGEGSLKAWLYKVQQNVIFEHIRQMSQWQDIIPIEESILEDIPEPETITDIPSSVLQKMIAELPIGYRTVFNMFVIEGLSHKEIAKTLGIQEKSSSSQLFHAKKILATEIIKWRKENL
ncbi:MAG: sigma-70 family RNA polymerase sigma factor [Bacteroidales bacterium]|nr:sigma-70 family RNA polymerase sigma factor [Bacteroidales bacterium]